MIARTITTLLALVTIALTATAEQPVRFVTPVVGHLDGTIVAELTDSETELEAAFLQDGRRLVPTRLEITIKPDLPPSAWIAPPLWSPTPKGEPADRVFLVFQAPADAVGQGISTRTGFHHVVWLTPPTDAAALSSPIAPTSLATDTFRDLLAPLEQSPIERWRHRLAKGSLVRPNPRPLEPSDPIELLGASIERRWVAALGRLHDADPVLAARTRAALITDIRFGESRPVPVSLATQDEEAELLADLLNPALTPEKVIDRTTLWLATRPASRSWIVDAGGTARDADGHPVLAVGIANLREDDLTIRIDRPGNDPSLERIDLPAKTAVGELARSVVPPPPDTLVPVQPPGADMTAFHPTLTMHAWRSGTTPTSPQLIARLDRAPSQPNQPPQWRLYLERQRSAPNEPFTIRLHQGFASRSRTAAISQTGEVVSNDQIQVRLLEPDAARWRAFVTIPPDWIDDDNHLRLGIEFERADATRWTWPRPILPWQTTRPRANFDLSAWDRLPEPRDPFSR